MATTVPLQLIKAMHIAQYNSGTVSDFQLSMSASIWMVILLGAVVSPSSDWKTNLTEVYGWGRVADHLEVTHG